MNVAPVTEFSPATNGVGKLAYTCTGVGCTSSSYSYLRKQSYDSKGRPSTATLSINSSSGTTYHLTYDSLSGKVATVKYPSTFTIANHYQSLYGYLSSITDNATSATLWTITGRNAELQATGQTLGTGDTETQVFDPNTGLIQNITAGPTNALANFSYSFDLIGNLTYRGDTLNGYSEVFCYDTLNRLTNYAVNLATCSATGSKSVTYNLIGNIKSKSDIATNYTYPSSGSSSVLPHAVSSITGTVGGLVNPHYCYDANGNLTKVYTGGGGCTSTASKAVSWTSANMILQMVQGSTTVSLTYDEAHQRITQTEPSGTTAYFADPMTGAFAEEAGTTWNDYISVDGKLVAEHIQPSSGTAYVNYFINDHLGSVAVVKITNPSSPGVERDSYDAWGMRRNADGTDAPACNLVSSTKRGFTNQEMIDALCLVNLNARVYDPVIGRFLSPDDVVDDPTNLQHLNRYSYVNNGPLSSTDPTGHEGYSIFNEMGMVSMASGGAANPGGGPATNEEERYLNYLADVAAGLYIDYYIRLNGPTDSDPGSVNTNKSVGGDPNTNNRVSGEKKNETHLAESDADPIVEEYPDDDEPMDPSPPPDTTWPSTPTTAIETDVLENGSHRTINGYTVWSSTSNVNGVYTVNIAGLWDDAGQGEGLKALIDTFTTEAEVANASTLRIRGIAIINAKINGPNAPAIAARLGLTYQRLDNDTIELTKPVVPILGK